MDTGKPGNEGTPWPFAQGEMAQHLRHHDWASTPLGPTDTWPSRLRMAVELMLASRQPAYIAWGPALTSLYNDGCIPILGSKHADALGQPYARLWAEIWQELQPIVEATLAGQSQYFVDRPVALQGRPGLPMSWFTFSWTPLRDDEGRIAGFFCAATETTDKVLAEQGLQRADARNAFLLELSDALRPLADPVAIQAEASRVLGEQLGATRVLYGEVSADGADLIVERNYVGGTAAVLTGCYRMADFGPALVEALAAGRPVAVPDVATAPELSTSERKAYAALGVTAIAGVPLTKQGRFVANLNVHFDTPHAWTDTEMALISETAERTWAAVERARAEVAQRDSEQRYRTLFTTMDQGLCIIEQVAAPGQPLDFRYVAANPAFERHTGLRDVVGKTILQLVPGVEQEVMQIYGDVARTRRPQHFEAHVASLNLWIEADAFPAQAAGQVAVLFSNISTRKRAESALRESEAQMRAIANLVPDLLWRGDAQGEVQWYSERWFDYTGMPRQSALGHGWAEILHPEDLPGTLRYWHEATRLRQPYRFEHRLRRHDGEYRWFLSRAEPLFDADGSVRQWFGSVTDIHEQRTARELLEQRVKERTREVERASELRRQLLARVETLQDDERRRIARELHDSLGQFLSAMLLSIASLRQQPSDPVVAEHFSKLQQRLEAADHELDRIVFTLRPTALEDSGLADAVGAYVSTWSELSGRPVDLLVNGLDGQRLPPRVEAAIFRVVQEALNNIAKHAHAHNVSVSLERQGRQLIASVEDDGVGFDAEQAAPMDGSRPSWGLLGMRERIEALGGTFAIESRAGRGTAVLLRVPLH